MKPGYKTTEFWVSVITALAAFLAAIVGELPDKYAALTASVVTVGYAIARGLAKVYPPKPGP